jgi:hypothetical protein
MFTAWSGAFPEAEKVSPILDRIILGLQRRKSKVFLNALFSTKFNNIHNFAFSQGLIRAKTHISQAEDLWRKLRHQAKGLRS